MKGNARSLVFRACGLMVLASLLLFIARRYGIAPHDAALACAVGVFALLQRRSDRHQYPLLGEKNSEPPIRWSEFLCDNHQLVGIVMRGRRRRSERLLALAVTTLALLYWKAIFRPPPVRMSSLMGLRSSIYTLVVSKSVQLMMKQAIRVMAGRMDRWQAQAGWMETLQLQWKVVQCWVFGFMLLCVGLFLRDGWGWSRLLSGWMKNMAFALVVMDLAFCYIRFSVLYAFRSRIRPRSS